jgi:CheY-like chemotaxis protein
VDVAEDGEQARAMGSEVDYDLVILDLNLQRLDGVAVLRHLRLRRPSLPVLVLTLRSTRGRPGAVSGHGSRRLSAEGVFLRRTIRAHPRAACGAATCRRSL